MKSTKALKMACLSVGLATAWSPLGGQAAHAGTVDVSLNIATSSGERDPGPFNAVAIGLVFSDNSVEVYDLLLTNNFSSDGAYDRYVVTTSNLDIIGYMVAGLTPSTSNVMVSIEDPFSFANFDWDTIFPTYTTPPNSETTLHSFLTSILSSSSTYANILQGPDDLVSLYKSPDNNPNYDAYGHVSISLEAATVPLPNACLMGGGLFALMALGKRSVKWIHLRQPQSLA